MSDENQRMRGKRSGSNAALRSGSFAPSRTGPGGPQGNSRASSDSGPRATCSSNEVILERSGPDPFFLRIADLTIALLSDDSDLKISVDSNIKRFLVGQADPDVRIQAKWGDLSKEKVGEKIFDSGGVWQLYSQNQTYLFRFTSPALGSVPYKIAFFNREFTSGEVCLHLPYFTMGQPLYPLEYPLDELLIINLLASEKGLEVHACGIIDPSGNGHLFVGQSDAGKTTMARLWQNVPGIIVLSDDRIILRQNDGVVWIYGTPWHGEAKLASPARAPLKEVLFLQHGSRNERVSIGKAEAVARFISCSFVPFYNPDGMEFSLGFCDEVVKSAPSYELGFVPDKSVVEFILGNKER